MKLQSKEPAHFKPLSFSGYLVVAGYCAVASGALILALIILPYTVHLSTLDLRDYVEPGSYAGRFLLNGVWIIFLAVGILLGTMHRWFKEEQILKSGLEELREWRRTR